MNYRYCLDDIIFPNPDKCIATDASSCGWGAVMESSSTGDHKQIKRMWFHNKRDLAMGLWFFYMIVCTFTRDTKYRSRLWIPEIRNTHWATHMWKIGIYSNYRSVCNKNQYTAENFCFLTRSKLCISKFLLNKLGKRKVLRISSIFMFIQNPLKHLSG